ncbi:response regulator, partial [Salmonella enterica subsp. enterica serovar Anatum]|nr:response regulator [Salmonella enterica subsp. enterica serovar Anatum]
ARSNALAALLDHEGVMADIRGITLSNSAALRLQVRDVERALSEAEMDGIATLKEIKALNPAIPILIMTAFSSVETAVEALKAGAL